MNMADESDVLAVAVNEIMAHAKAEGYSQDEYKISVLRESNRPRIWLVFWDVIQPNEDGKVLNRATGVEMSEDAEVLRKRIRHEFSKKPRLCGLYDWQPVVLMNV